MVIWPAVPTGTSTRFGTVLPATQFRFEASGRVPPAGYTVRKLEAVVLVTVTLSTTALALAGAPGVTPATVRLMDPAAPTGPPTFLVSSRRPGVTAVYVGGSGTATVIVADLAE